MNHNTYTFTQTMLSMSRGYENTSTSLQKVSAIFHEPVLARSMPSFVFHVGFIRVMLFLMFFRYVSCDSYVLHVVIICFMLLLKLPMYVHVVSVPHMLFFYVSCYPASCTCMSVSYCFHMPHVVLLHDMLFKLFLCFKRFLYMPCCSSCCSYMFYIVLIHCFMLFLQISC